MTTMTAVTQAPDFAAIKARQRQTWAAGDFQVIASLIMPVSERLCEAVDLRAGERVLDVATGSGNTAIAAARRLCEVTGVDYVPALLERGRVRAAAEGFAITFQEGDAEALPVADAAYDVALSTFGSMFAPNQEQAARELLRVCRPGGRIALLNWTPRSFVGQLYLLVCQYAALPPQLAPPVLWGVEATVRERLSAGIAGLQTVPRVYPLAYPFGPEAVADLYIANLGVIQRAYAGLDPEGQAALRRDLTGFFADNNRAGDGTTRIDAECLEAVATRA